MSTETERYKLRCWRDAQGKHWYVEDTQTGELSCFFVSNGEAQAEVDRLNQNPENKTKDKWQLENKPCR